MPAGLRKRPAFTLIKILVVVGVIALLVAILLPSLSRARESARRSVCLSNLHQLAGCWPLFHTESRGVPIYATPSDLPGGEDPQLVGPGWIRLTGTVVRNLFWRNERCSRPA